ncbi:MAG: hypothetical protein WD208_12925 [Dehalococcoidia bacterium]
MKESRPVSVTALISVFMFVLLVSCGGEKAPAQSGETPDLGAGPPNAATLAIGITQSSDFQSAIDATQSALAQGGISTADGQETHMQPSEPAAFTTVSLVESAHMAMEARNRSSAGRLTLAEMGQMLEDFGWPFLEGSTPGEQLASLLGTWVSEARTDPGAPLSFTPLFMSEMALRQEPAIRLDSASYDPDELRLTMLEVQLFVAAFDRVLSTDEPAVLRQGLMGLWPSIPVATDPCSEINDLYGKIAEDAAKPFFSEGVGIYISESLKKAGVDPAEVDKVSSAMTALGIAARLAKTANLYSNAHVHVASEGSLHKPLKTEVPGRALTTAFVATAGISDSDWQTYQDAVDQSDETVKKFSDCLGLPRVTDLADIGRDARNWGVNWALTEGAPEHALISLEPNDFTHPGQMRMNMDANGEHSASATFVVDIVPEEGESHSGPEKTGRVTARAEVDTTQVPQVGTLIGAIIGGLKGGGLLGTVAAPLADLGADWFQTMFPPKAYGTLQVAYHEGEIAEQWTGTITFAREATYETSSMENLEPRGGYERWRKSAEERVTSYEQTWQVDGEGTRLNREVTVPASFNMRYRKTYTLDAESKLTNSCAGETEPTWRTTTMRDVEEAQTSGATNVSVTLKDNGSYVIIAEVSDYSARGAYTYEETVEYGPGCGGPQDPYNKTRTGDFEFPARSAWLSGEIDPEDPSTLSGTETETEDYGSADDVSAGSTWTWTWDLTRSPAE